MARKKDYEANRKSARRAARVIGKQRQARAVKSKYGQTGKPAPVVVKRLDGSTETFDQAAFQRTRRKAKFDERLNARARAIGYADYADYLRSPWWRTIRRQRIEKDRRRCAKCSAAKGLQVHHVTYEHLGHEEMGDLVTLCVACHRQLHNL